MFYFYNFDEKLLFCIIQKITVILDLKTVKKLAVFTSLLLDSSNLKTVEKTKSNDFPNTLVLFFFSNLTSKAYRKILTSVDSRVAQNCPQTDRFF